MGTETYPKKSGQGKDGSKSGWSGDGGAQRSYPGKAANTRDDFGKVKQEAVKHAAKAGGSAQVSATYPKKKWGDKFPNLAGLK
jgi:hypothetical protein